jgi:hypothetical protein
MRQTSRIPGLRLILLATLLFSPTYLTYPYRAAAQNMPSPAPLQLTFPLKATVPDQDQHLTSATAPANSVFDHSMLDATTHYVVYGCDKTVVAFDGTTAPYGPGYPILGIGCNAGYKVENVQLPPPISLAPNMTYFGWGVPSYLFYDGHPGIDYVAAMDTQVYAVANGTVHYPTRMVGLGYPAAAYHVLEIVPDHAPAIPPPYVIYYLHLDTYVGQNKVPVTDPDPLPGCSATVYCKRQRKHMVDRLWSKSLPASTGCGGLRDPLSQKADSQGATPGFANCSHPAVCKTVADPGANFMHQGHAERPVFPTLQERGWIVSLDPVWPSRFGGCSEDFGR